MVREPDAEIDWWVLADPEGNEFCAFAPELHRHALRLGTANLDPTNRD